MPDLIYKIAPRALWEDAEATGVFRGAPIDLADGYIHFSTRDQVLETADKHFANEHDLLLVAIDEEKLGEALRYEPSRGGALFPHLYGPLRLDAVVWVKPFARDPEGRFAFPEAEQ